MFPNNPNISSPVVHVKDVFSVDLWFCHSSSFSKELYVWGDKIMVYLKFGIIIIYTIQSPISNLYKHTSSVDCTQYGLYTFKQYDNNQILNKLVHITLLHTIIYVLNENYACTSQYIRNINIYIST